MLIILVGKLKKFLAQVTQKIYRELELRVRDS